MWNSQALGQCKVLNLVTGTQHRVLSSWDLGSGLVSLVPRLSNALVMVGVKKELSF